MSDEVVPGAVCPGCGSRRAVQDGRTGERLCPHCGYVLDPVALDAGPSFPRGAVTGEPASGHGPGQAPYSPRRPEGTIFHGSRDGQGHILSSARQREFQILRRREREGEHRRTHHPGTSPRGQQIVHQLVLTMALPELIEEAALLVLRKGGESHLFRGRSASAAAAASVYAACRRYSLPTTWTEISRAAGISRADFGRAYMALRRGLNLDLPPVGLGSYVRRFSTELKLSAMTTGRALHMVNSANGHPDSSGISPNGLVGAALYMASMECREPRRQSEVARVAQVTDVTLRHAFRRLAKILGKGPG